MKMILASSNEHKIKEISSLLKDFNVEVKCSKDYNIKTPLEDGKDFLENSYIKAKHAFELTGLPSLGDDSGFCIESLGGFPGLCSARFAESVGGHEEAFRILNDCINPSNKNACFITAMTFIYEKDGEIKSKSFEGRVNGSFTYPARGFNGFGYCPVFEMTGSSQTFAEISNECRTKINHRSIALQKFLNFFKSISD